jgi:hypothetical protein
MGGQWRVVGRGGGVSERKKKKTEIRAEKGQRKNVNPEWHRDRKEKPLSAPSIHVGALVAAGSLQSHMLLGE